MHCKNCSYPLWNLDARRCPECATPFKPSDYEFVPGTVRFSCPECGQSYYGTDDHGHLDPRQFSCVKCEKLVHMDQMIVLPAAGLEERQTQADRMPWIDRGGRNFIAAWFSTMKWAMLEPARLIRATPANISMGRAWLFATVSVVIFLLIGAYLPFLAQMAMVSFNSFGGGMGGFVYSSGGWMTPAIGILLVALYLLIWAGVTHLVLMMTGKRSANFQRTCHCVFFSSVAGVLTAVPCCGWLIGPPWWIVSGANMLKESQQVHGARAAIAILVWPLLSIGLWVVGYFILIFVMLTGFMGGGMGVFGGGGMGPAGMGPSNDTSLVNMELVTQAQSSTGVGPDHAIELAFSSSFGGGWGVDFCETGTNTTTADIPVGTGTFAGFLTMTRSQQLGAAKSALDAMPQGVIAHRFGDYIFVHHGAVLNTWDPQLWLVVMLPDPVVNPAPAPNDPVYIGTSDYSVKQISFSQLAAEIAKQNKHRATIGLPPLPDLTTVKHGQPAIDPALGGTGAGDGEE